MDRSSTSVSERALTCEGDVADDSFAVRPLRISGVFPHVAQLRHSLVDIACLGSMADYFPEKNSADNLTEQEFVHFIKTKVSWLASSVPLRRCRVFFAFPPSYI